MKKQLTEHQKQQTRDYHNKIYFGGNRIKALERDGYKCVKCGMTNEEHIKVWNRQITIHHIDGQGRYSKVVNNSLENLETLCLNCHGKKDIYRSPNTKPMPLIQFTLNWDVVRRYDSLMDAERYGYKSKSISKVCHGINKTHFGYYWRIAEDVIEPTQPDNMERRFDKKFRPSVPNQLPDSFFAPQCTSEEMKDFIRSERSLALKEGEAIGKAYIGKTKREWYSKGFKEGAEGERKRIRELVAKDRVMFLKKEDIGLIDEITAIRKQLRKEILADIDSLK